MNRNISARLYVKGAFIGYRRGKNVIANPNHALVQINGVVDAKDSKFYLGKRVAYIYKAKTEKKGTKFRCIWGRIVRAHGTGGVCRATFRRNLPPAAMVNISYLCMTTFILCLNHSS